ncbi:MAG: hypothetical protein A2015_11155 [Spirochaetes bacterium GWF1_31_7]|nr:MAG: hypothetical protein A2Y30_02390 [Spirochaetes bacterium GWE1_32_154]OHD46385.1 MAG: hypothetical protein A2Y29_04250 [Spirochaetes bacterium GWE2_31_10]OHD47794.1 MAG: hypothetical protein A2015_11155 [Spirochaetes bacterium GWF1_31_7]OHD82779.1 MAG: hypothetical protein A2355_13010 [Spirochaetes bacterium RIFOXYB1_FULL_32_8]
MFACFCFTCAETRNLIIAGIPEEPNRWITSSGQYRGLDIDIVDFIFKELKIPYTVILEEASTRLEGNWKKPVSPYDMVFTYSKNSEREVYLIYAEESHIDFSWNFFYRKEDQNKYKYDTYEDLRGIRIGATQGFSYTDEFWNASKSGILTLDTVVANEIQIEKLLKKRTELVPLNTQATLYEAKQKGILDKIAYLPKPIKSKPYYNTFVKSSTYPDIDTVIIKYNEILKRMKSDGTLKKILSEYGL